MAVAYDTVGAGNSANSTSTSWSHPIGSSATALIVAVACYNSTAGYGSYTRSAKCGTTTMTSLGVINGAGAVGKGFVELFGLISPPTGSQTITYTISTAVYIDGSSVSYTGVGSFGTAVTAQGTTASGTTGAVSSASGHMVVAGFCGYQGYTWSSPSNTSRYNYPSTATTNYEAILIQDAAGASSVTMTATLSGAHANGSVAVDLIAATTSTPTNLFFAMF